MTFEKASQEDQSQEKPQVSSSFLERKRGVQSCIALEGSKRIPEKQPTEFPGKGFLPVDRRVAKSSGAPHGNSPIHSNAEYHRS
jgi:hypothetical protein